MTKAGTSRAAMTKVEVVVALVAEVVAAVETVAR